MTIHIAYRGDGVYRVAEHQGIHRVARELGFDNGMSDSDIRQIVAGTLEEYHSECLPDPAVAESRFDAAAAALYTSIKGSHTDKRLVCGYLLSIATADNNIAPGELEIINELEVKWGLERTRVPF